jgi:hypothetical protein
MLRMRKMPRFVLVGALAAIVAPAPLFLHAAPNAVIGWNNLGMHCTDGSDFSVFSILPHFNTIQAHVVAGGRLVTNAALQGVSVTYEAVPDPAGSINRTSVGKGNFYSFVGSLYGAALAPDMGLAGSAMPGAANKPQPMTFDPANEMVHRHGRPDHPLRRRGPEELLSDDAPGGAGPSEPLARHDGHRAAGL